jgi:hypothetical protein
MTGGTAGSPAAGTPAAGDRAAGRYVYGVVPAAQARKLADLRGLGEPPRPVGALVDDGLAALVSPVEAGFTAGTRADLEAHERVLSDAVQRTTVVPMRFGVVMDTEDVVRDTLLRRHAARLQELLQRLEGHVQMSVKAYYGEDVLVREVVRDQPEIARAEAALRGRPEAATRGARIALGEMVSAGVTRHREAEERRLAERLASVVAEVRVDPPASDRMALNAQLLVRRDRRAALDKLVEELARENEGRLGLRYVGPIAPYSFADVALEA